MAPTQEFLQIKNGYSAVTWGFERTELASAQRPHVISIFPVERSLGDLKLFGIINKGGGGVMQDNLTFQAC